MLKIRYQRVGRKNHAHFRLVVAEDSAPIQGKIVEALGSYNPHTKETTLKEDRIKHWIANGAQCSDSAFNLLVTKGVVDGPKRKINLRNKKKEEGVEEGVKEGDAKEAEKQEAEKQAEEENKEEKADNQEETKPAEDGSKK